MALMLGSLQLGFIYGLLAVGIYISFRILNTPDLTAEGSFTLGLAISARVAVAGHPWLGLLAGLAAGCLAGMLTGFFQTVMKIHPILAGILTMSGLYSVNIFVMGASNLSLLTGTTVYKELRELMPFLGKEGVKLALSAFFAVIAFAALVVFFKTKIGLRIRATGDNEEMVRASSINADFMRILALAVSNGCIALSGALLAQYQGYADISSGVGILVVGLASVIIGEVFGGRKGVTAGLAASILGSVIYRYIIALAMRANVFPAYMLKLMSALIVMIALSIPAIRHSIGLVRQKRGNR